MSEERRDWRPLAIIPLAIYLVAAGIGMWFMDPVTQQNQFAAFLASEFLTVALMIYILLHRDFGKLAMVWFTLWWLFLTLLLSLAFY